MSLTSMEPSFPAAAEKSSKAGWLVPATWSLVVLGVAARLIRYAVNYPIWHDEAFLAVNFWDRDFVDLMRPLQYGQVAPWLFLVIERSAVLLLGYTESALRLYPTICSVLSLPFFCVIAGRHLDPKARLIAVAVLAVSVYPIRHGAEIKPYSSDLLASLILIGMALEWTRNPQSSRWWWALAIVSPLLLALSYPAIFVAGGISLGSGLAVWRSGNRNVRLGWMVYSIVAAASFLAIYLAFTSTQALAMREQYRDGCWVDAFPPLRRPWMIPVWLLDVHAGVMMAHPAGDRHGGSIATLACVIAGGLVLYRTRRHTLLAILAAPFGLGLLASFLGRYPYGGAPRVMLYLTPSICLLGGLGAIALLERLPRTVDRRRGFRIVLAATCVLGCGIILKDLVRPYRIYDDVRTREFAQWLWTTQAESAELVCLKTDLGLSMEVHQWNVGMSAVYLFHQRMFSDRHHRKETIDLNPAHYSESRPMRLVAFDHLPTEYPAFRQWLDGLEKKFERRGSQTYVIQPGKSSEHWLRDSCEVVEYIPRAGSAGLAEGETDRARR